MAAAHSYSRWTGRSVHLCSKTPHACFHARGSSVRCPLAKALIQCTRAPGELVICGLAPPPDGASLPRANARVLALLQRDSLRSLPPHRPHVSLSEVLPRPSLLAGSHPTRHTVGTSSCLHERTCQVTLFPVPMVRIRRAVLSTGFRGSAYRSDFRLPAPYPVPFGSIASASCAGSF